jgi:ribosomal peptide maturation radical SAM protein 1
MSRVLLINMPFASLRWPNIGPSLLKAALARRGIGCDVAYLNFDFAERTGIDHYNWIADDFAFVLGGERLFAGHYFDTLPTDDESYYRNVLLAADEQFTDEDRRQYERTASHVGPFLDRCTASIDWTRYGVVGFAVSFQQTMSSMCLARRIKQLRPDVRIALGGAACEGEMGIELLRRFPPVDYVFLGEADATFPAVVEQLFSGGPVRLPPGVVGGDPREAGPAMDSRAATDSQAPDSCMVRRMDDLPYPDYDDYFARLGAGTLRERIDPLLPFETSRGCWWGRKHQCAFCGLNGGTLAFRGKSPGRAVEELRYLVDRHNVHRAYATDNILDLRYFDTFLPALDRANLDLSFAFEMKTNLTRRQVEILLAAGLGAAQLGIETFSTPLLGRIGKGTTALHNVQALKWFTEAGVTVQWNLLYGFPGEEPAEYAAMAELIPSLVHLAPPQATGRVRMDRFAPYFNDPAAHGLIHVYWFSLTLSFDELELAS